MNANLEPELNKADRALLKLQETIGELKVLRRIVDERNERMFDSINALIEEIRRLNKET